MGGCAGTASLSDRGEAEEVTGGENRGRQLFENLFSNAVE